MKQGRISRRKLLGNRKMRNSYWLFTTVLFIVFTQVGVGGTIYVDVSASGANNGSSWIDAYNYLQDALVPATSGNDIWVAQGTYKPDQGGGTTPGDRYATFELKDGVGIYGGFPTGGDIWEDRDPNAFETILSGDLNGDDGADFSNNGENSYHIIMVSATSVTATLDGLTISGGNASDDYNINGWGSGLYVNPSGTLMVNNCRFVRNSSAWGGAVMIDGTVDIVNTNFISNRITASGNSSGGGALYLYKSNSRITNCTFINNKSLTSLGRGGAVLLDEDYSILSNCGFINNNTHSKGGAIWCNECTLLSCTFIGNSSSEGGALYFNGYSVDPFNITQAYPTVINSSFIGNTADKGGAIHNYVATRPNFINCEFIGNYAVNSGGAFILDAFIPTSFSFYLNITSCSFVGNNTGGSGGGLYIYKDGFAETTIANSILWDNVDSAGSVQSSQISGGSIIASFSCIQDDNPDDASIPFGGSANNNIDDNPNFVRDPYDGGDGWGVGDNDDYGNLRLQHTSPCIDTGDNASIPADSEDLDEDLNTAEPIPYDLDDHPRIVDGDCDSTATVDMGAYELDWLYLGDFAGGCDIDLGDFAVLAQNFQQDNPAIDIVPFLEPDGVIDLKELLVIVEHWLKGTEL